MKNRNENTTNFLLSYSNASFFYTFFKQLGLNYLRNKNAPIKGHFLI